MIRNKVLLVLWDLALLIVKDRQIEVLVGELIGEHQIADLKLVADRTGAAGVYDGIDLKGIDQDGGSGSGTDLTDT